MSMLIVDDDIDFSQVMSEDEHHKVKAASEYAEDVANRLKGDPQGTERHTPWRSLTRVFRPRQGELTIWTGFKGHGKTTALSQFELCLLSQGAKTLKLSMEFAPAEVLKKSLLQCAHKIPDSEYTYDWFRWTDGRMWLYDHKGSVTADKVIGVIRYAVDKFNIDFVTVDSLMKCGIAPDDFNRQKDFVDKLQNICHQFGTQIHLVAHSRKKEDDSKPAQMHDIKGASEICDMAENVCSFWRNKPKEKEASKQAHERKRDKEPDALIVIESQRNGSGWCGAVPLVWHGQSLQYLEGYNDNPSDYSRVF